MSQFFSYYNREGEWVWMFIFLDPAPRGSNLTNCPFNVNEKSPCKGWKNYGDLLGPKITCHAANLLRLNSKSFYIFANFQPQWLGNCRPSYKGSFRILQVYRVDWHFKPFVYSVMDKFVMSLDYSWNGPLLWTWKDLWLLIKAFIVCTVVHRNGLWEGNLASCIGRQFQTSQITFGQGMGPWCKRWFRIHGTGKG